MAINAFKTVNTNISIVRGDTLAFGFELKQTDEANPDIMLPFTQELATAYFTVTKDYENTQPVIQKLFGNGISIVEDGKYRVRIAPEDTEELDPGVYYYDCEIGINGDYFTILRGAFVIESDSTTRSSARDTINEQLTAIVNGTLTRITAAELGTLTEIRDYAFYGCRLLGQFEIQNSVRIIGGYAFAYCESLQTIVIPNGVTEVGNSAFRNCTGLKHVEIPDTVTTIKINAFYGCSELESVRMTENITEITQGLFYTCSKLKSIDIPADVTNIASNAFYGCAELESMTVRAVNPPVIAAASALNGAKADMIIYVPAASVDTYKAAQYWSARANYIQAIPS